MGSKLSALPGPQPEALLKVDTATCTGSETDTSQEKGVEYQTTVLSPANQEDLQVPKAKIAFLLNTSRELSAASSKFWDNWNNEWAIYGQESTTSSSNIRETQIDQDFFHLSCIRFSKLLSHFALTPTIHEELCASFVKLTRNYFKEMYEGCNNDSGFLPPNEAESTQWFAVLALVDQVIENCPQEVNPEISDSDPCPGGVLVEAVFELENLLILIVTRSEFLDKLNKPDLSVVLTSLRRIALFLKENFLDPESHNLQNSNLIKLKIQTILREITSSSSGGTPADIKIVGVLKCLIEAATEWKEFWGEIMEDPLILKESKQFLSIILPIVKFHPEQILKSEQFIINLRSSFLCSTKNDSKSVIGTSILQHLGLHLGTTIEQDPKSPNALPLTTSEKILLGHLGSEKYFKFWEDFFDLYNILDEKQSHIILPVMTKLTIFSSPDDFVCRWYLVILSKMIQHDNRLISREGLERFFALAPDLQPKPSSKKASIDKTVIDDFFLGKVLPFLSTQVGWVLAEPEIFFKNIKSCGALILALYEGYTNLMVSKIMTFLTQKGSCHSPLCYSFCIESLSHAFEWSKYPVSRVPISEVDIDLEHTSQLVECLTLITQCCSQGLPSVDKFLRIRIERQLVLIVKEFGLKSRNFRAQPKPSLGHLTDITLKYLGFIGSICEDAMSELETYSEFSTLWEVRKFWEESKDAEVLERIEKDFSELQTQGLFRWWLFLLTKSPTSSENLSRVIVVDGILERLGEIWSIMGSPGSLLLPGASAGTNDLLHYIFYKPYTNPHCRKILSNRIKKLIQAKLPLLRQICKDKETFMEVCISLHFVKLLLSKLSVFFIPEDILVLDIKQTLQSTIQKLVESWLPQEECSPAVARSIPAEEKFIIWKLLSLGGINPSPKTPIQTFMIFFMNDLGFQSNTRSRFNISSKPCSDNKDSKGETEVTLEAQYFLEFGQTLRSDYYQIKFEGFTSLLQRAHFSGDPISLPFREYFKKYSTSQLKLCFSSWMEQMEKAGPGGVIPTLGYLKAMLPYFKDFNGQTEINLHEMLQSFTELAWKLVFEMRKTDKFWKGIEQFVNFITEPYFEKLGTLPHYAEKIFKAGETIPGLPLSLILAMKSKLGKRELPKEALENISNVCLTAVLYGPPIPKNSTVLHNLWQYILANEAKGSDEEKMIVLDENHFTSNGKIRIGALTIVKTLSTQSPILISKVVEHLLERNDEESKTRSRYFENSSTHRLKQRIAQTLLVLQPNFTQELDRLVIEKLLHSLCSDSPQPTVRFLMEWTVVRILAKGSSCWSLFFETSSQCCSKRVGFAAFFSTMCLHTAKILKLPSAGSEVKRIVNVKEQEPKTKVALNEPFFKDSLTALAELAFSHHVTVRAYSQICFLRILKLVWDIYGSSSGLAKHFEFFAKSMQASLLSAGANFTKMHGWISKDFYVRHHQADLHYTPIVIFVNLLRIYRIAKDEIPLKTDLLEVWPPNTLDQKVLDEIEEIYNVNYEEHLVHGVDPGLKIDGKEINEEMPLDGQPKPKILPTPTFDNSSSPVGGTSQNFQKKINPWKNLAIGVEMDEFSDKLIARKEGVMSNGLVVVASLIDKIPNLGGLCRSCEIFGVTKYVIPNMKVLEDQQFLSLSVSAHKWVDILEVPPKDLESFLATYKAKGYQILGVEQAEESTKLNEFNFTKKSVLLLGNEKYGIPNNLLHLVDRCIEIPQVGVIRSLNVHVTGALCIWQYASQNAFIPSSSSAQPS